MADGKTKIVCTIGPASSSYECLQELVDSGMNVVRLNFSHGTYGDHLDIIQKIRRLRQQTGRNIGILQDLSGPKIRVGDLPAEGVDLPTGSTVFLMAGAGFEWTDKPLTIPVSYPALTNDVPTGSRILLDDGSIALEVRENTGERLRCSVVNGGTLRKHKGVNFPDQTLSQTVPTAKDLEDLSFGMRNDVDFVAQSFVQSAHDMLRLREAVKEEGGDVAIIAKLERSSALQNLDSILEVSDGVMVARGDLGIEADLSMIPIYQKLILRKANLGGLFAITATQMLDSMIRQPTPTRAEVTDVANATYDGSDAIMLSGETSVGKYPVETVRMMRTIANHVEDNLGLDRGWIREESPDLRYTNEMAVATSVCTAAEKIGAKLIIAYTISGKTAKTIAMYRPITPIVAITPKQSTHYQLSLVWGIRSILLPQLEADFVKSMQLGEIALKKHGFVQNGDQVVVSAGIPAGYAGGTNLMKIQIIGQERTAL